MFQGIWLTDATMVVADAMWAENEAKPACSIRLFASSSLNIKVSKLVEHIGSPGRFYVEAGTIWKGDGGEAAFLDYYRATLETIACNTMAGEPIPGVSEFRVMLSSKVVDLGGTPPGCDEN